jgi:hypothetical protein
VQESDASPVKSGRLITHKSVSRLVLFCTGYTMENGKMVVTGNTV